MPDAFIGEDKMTEFVKWWRSPKVLISVMILAGAFVLWVCIRRGFKTYIRNGKNGENSTLSQGIYDAIKYTILLGTLLAVLQVNGVNVGSMVAGLGLASAIVGLALQDALKDSIMGIHLITDHFFEVGDVVRYEDFEGVVMSFNMKTTKLQNIYDNSVMTICNRNISQIVTISDWMDIDIPLAYEEDERKIHTVLKKICEQIRKTEGIEDCIYKGTQDFGDSAVIYKIRIFCPPKEKPELRRKALAVVQDGLEKAGLSIPYQQLDVHSGLKG